jgi:hypothetical protein
MKCRLFHETIHLHVAIQMAPRLTMDAAVKFSSKDQESV